MRAMIAKMFAKIDGVTNPKIVESYETEVDDLINGIQRICITAIKILIAITILMLIFGDSRLIDGAPLMWRIGYEWTHMINNILHHLLAGEAEGVFRR